MEIITGRWVYLENYDHGRMFAADGDKMGSDHMVETSPAGGDSEKYQWQIHGADNGYYIQNKLRGFMFAADSDKKGSDHLAECDPSVITLEQARAKGKQSSKWKWNIQPARDGLTITNQNHGQLFAADQDKKGDDHLVETRPNASQSEDKWLWSIQMASQDMVWSYLENMQYGRMFAADQDKKGNDHLVEADPLCQDGDKYQWFFHWVNGEYFIQNKKHGFMFAADSDLMDGDHIVECAPDVTTLLQAIKRGRTNDKWKWRLPQASGDVLSRLENVRYGPTFAADQDKKDNDHMVEARPNGQAAGQKWMWLRNAHWSPANWMGELASTLGPKPLKNVVIPGTHDSGSYACTATSGIAPEQDVPQWINAVWAMPLTGLVVMEVIARWSRAQGLDIGKQLESGIRYLDLRVVLGGNHQYYACHGLYGAAMSEVIEQIRRFLDAHPKELVILDFNHLYAMPALADNRPLIEQLLNAFGHKMAPNTLSGNNTLNDFWNKGYQVIALYDNAEAVRAYPQLWPQSKITSPWPDTTSVATLKKEMKINLDARARDKLFVLQGMLTPDGGMIAEGLIPFSGNPDSLQELADTVTPDVTNWLWQWRQSGQNIAIVDWFNLANYVGVIRQINMQ